MTHVVSGLIRKAPYIQVLDNNTMFVVELSEMTKEKDGSKTYTNYSAALFAKTEAAISYFTQATAEGAFIVIACDKLTIQSRESNGKTYTKLRMEQARIAGGQYGQGVQGGQPAQPMAQPMAQQAQPAAQPAQQQAQWQQPAQQAPVQQQPVQQAPSVHPSQNMQNMTAEQLAQQQAQWQQQSQQQAQQAAQGGDWANQQAPVATQQQAPQPAPANSFDDFEDEKIPF